jgi:hypothetical protein
LAPAVSDLPRRADCGIILGAIDGKLNGSYKTVLRREGRITLTSPRVRGEEI